MSYRNQYNINSGNHPVNQTIDVPPSQHYSDNDYYKQDSAPAPRLNSNYSQAAADNNNGSFNLDRRHYPKDELDRKNEWEAIERHKLEIIQQLAKSEDEIKNYRQQEFLTELDKKVLAKLEEKKEILEQQKQKAIQMQQENEQFQQRMIQGKNDQRSLGRFMGDYYSQQLEVKKQRQNEEKEQKLRWEQRLLDFNRAKLESEERRKREQKQFLNMERQNDLERAKLNKQMQKQNNDMAINEYRRLMMNNEQNLSNKDQNYKNFFEIAAINQDKKQLEYLESIAKQNLEKQKKIEGIIEKNYQMEQLKREQDEQQRAMNQLRNQIAFKEGNESIMGIKKEQQQNQKNLDQMMVQERLKDLDNYNKYQQYVKKEKLNSMESYKQELDKLVQEKMQKHQQSLRMTKNEKGINRNDLQAYKAYDDGLYSMIPGYSLQIGQLPPKENRERMQQRHQQQTMKLQGSQQSLENDQQNGNQQNDWQSNYQRSLNRDQLVAQSHPNLKQYQKIGERIDKYNQSMVYEATKKPMKSNVPDNLLYGHNPLTNPMPINIQNPYLAREYERAQNRGRYLQSVGQNVYSSAQA